MVRDRDQVLVERVVIPHLLLMRQAQVRVKGDYHRSSNLKLNYKLANYLWRMEFNRSDWYLSNMKMIQIGRMKWGEGIV
jgi:hypothetical protein